MLVLSDETYGLPFEAVSGCSADSMDVVGYFAGHVIVYYEVYIWDIQASGGQVCCHKDIGLIGPEHAKVGNPLVQLHKRMQSNSPIFESLQSLGHQSGLLTHLHKDNYLVHSILLQEGEQVSRFELFGSEDIVLGQVC